MTNIKTYGHSPYSIAVVHGGPGAAGSMAPIAKRLSEEYGILELLQTKTSIEEQIKELHQCLLEHGDPPVTLIGHSWGAWLSFLTAACYPDTIKKLILVASGPFEDKYIPTMKVERLKRLDKDELSEFRHLTELLANSSYSDKNKAFAKLGKIITIADSFMPIENSSEYLDCQFDIYESIWKEAVLLRSSGELLNYAYKIQCPVTAIHGDYDPHPYIGVKEPLSKILRNFNFILLNSCGHEPWNEKLVKEQFFDILRKELR